MHLLVITKKPEYGEKGHLVTGQCDPQAPGWELRLLLPPTGGAAPPAPEALLQGAYGHLRSIQLRCRGKGLDEIRACVAEEQKKTPGPVAGERRATGVGDRRAGSGDRRTGSGERETAPAPPAAPAAAGGAAGGAARIVAAPALAPATPAAPAAPAVPAAPAPAAPAAGAGREKPKGGKKH